MMRTVLIADDDSTIRTVLSQAFSRAGYNVRATGLASAAWRWISEGEGDVFVTDVILPDENAFDVLPRIHKLRPNLPVVVISAQNTIMTAIRAAELGAYDYLPKPFDLSALVQVVGKALEQSTRPQTVKQEVHGEALPLVGRSATMQEIYRVIARLTQTDLTAMIIGESGTGKELVARALHDYGKRRKGQFVAINMAAIPRELIESELFGHEKGSFTGATGRMAGRFEQAEGGTLFLDEIGDMPIETQTRLLRVLQQGEFMSVGGTTAIKSNVRIIAATHRDLRQLISQGLFREDLFFRLNVVPLRLPPLRERLEDIPDLVRHFQARAIKEGLPHKDFDAEALEMLSEHRWPGNIRELENLVKRLLAMEVDDSVSAAAVRRELIGMQITELPSHAAMAAQSLTEFLDGHLGRYFASFGQALPPEGIYDRFLAELEAPLLRATLTATRGNQIKAADLLGINRNTLRTKLRDRHVQVVRGIG
jgi:two-component system, NtrC family, nitrogen regulation response regulator GlnG